MEKNLPAPKFPPYSLDLPFDRHFLRTSSRYETEKLNINLLSRIWPGAAFYLGALGAICHLSKLAVKGEAGDVAWVEDSARIAKALEHSGGRIIIEGMEHIASTPGPCLFVANHMSTLETMILPSIIHPRKRVTYVVKRSLCSMPVFGNIMRSRDPIIVDRVNPRQDLETVLKEGVKNLEQGISIIIFPQSTRTLVFNREKFNSLGVKLARRANVPVVPLALKTDAWGQGKIMKDFGKFTPEWPAHLRFAPPMTITGAGKEEHAAICDFIEASLAEWAV